MKRIFISYSRADRPFVDEFVPLLQKVYADASIWFDDAIPGGHQWWQLILGEIATCDLFIYLLSNDALASPYCQAEFREALRLQKPFLPVTVRSKTQIGNDLPHELADILQQTQYVDLSGGFKDYQATAALYAAINLLLERPPAPRPAPMMPQPVRRPPVSMRERGQRKSSARVWPVLLGIVLVGGCTLITLLAVMSNLLGGNRANPTTVPPVAFAPTITPFTTNIPSGSGGIEGQVADRASGRGLYGVEITFVSADGGFRQVVTSGENGVYRIGLPVGSYHVTATYQGYEPYSTGSGVAIVPDSDYQHGDILMVAQGAANSHVFTASDQLDDVTPDFRQLEVRYDENTVRVTLEFSKPEDVEQADDTVYFYGSQAQEIKFDKDMFQLRLATVSDGWFDTVQYEGPVDHPTSISMAFEFPLSLMSDIGHKEVWAYSMTSQDRIPDDSRLLTQ